MLPLPAAVQQQIDLALAEMRADPTHHLAPARRSAIYDAFGELNDPVVNNVCCWLPILTAEHVLPIWQIEAPFAALDDLPDKLITAAVGVLKANIDDNTAYALENKGYHAGGNGWGLGIFSWNAITAGFAAYHALVEVRRIKPLVDVEEWYEVFYEPVIDDTWNDETVCNSAAFADTASPAAIAYASGSMQFSQCDPQKLQEFWEWWLNEAIPDAWQRAQSEGEK